MYASGEGSAELLKGGSRQLVVVPSLLLCPQPSDQVVRLPLARCGLFRSEAVIEHRAGLCETDPGSFAEISSHSHDCKESRRSNEQFLESGKVALGVEAGGDLNDVDTSLHAAVDDLVEFLGRVSDLEVVVGANDKGR